MVLIRERYEEYRRTHPEARLTSLDTGNYYATFQDFGFTFRYNLLDRGLTVTPVIGATIPSHHYRTIGEAAPGQDRLALHTGVNVGRLLDPLLPNAYIHGRYIYSFVQRFRGIPLDRSSAEFEVGYAITPTVTVRALANWMRTHGGDRVQGGAITTSRCFSSTIACSPAATGTSAAPRPCRSPTRSISTVRW